MAFNNSTTIIKWWRQLSHSHGIYLSRQLCAVNTGMYV